MRLLVHAFRIIVRILTTENPCGRFAVFKTYLSLLTSSLLHHKVRQKKGILRAKLLRFHIAFSNHSDLLTLFEEIFVHQIYRFRSSSREPLIIDGGSHIGLSLLYFKTLFPHATLLCFEPDEENFKLLKTNLESNGLSKVDAVHAALSNTSEKTVMYKKPGPGTLNARLLQQDGDVIREAVCVSLSDFIIEAVDLLKLDVEGSEEIVIGDLIKSSKIRWVKRMIIEHHPHVTGHSTGSLIETIKKAGFVTEFRDNALSSTESMLYCEQGIK
jgi:FkbM family methyltransferase